MDFFGVCLCVWRLGLQKQSNHKESVACTAQTALVQYVQLA